jgi:hypothetical protein
VTSPVIRGTIVAMPATGAPSHLAVRFGSEVVRFVTGRKSADAVQGEDDGE